MVGCKTYVRNFLSGKLNSGAGRGFAKFSAYPLLISFDVYERQGCCGRAIREDGHATLWGKVEDGTPLRRPLLFGGLRRRPMTGHLSLPSR